MHAGETVIVLGCGPSMENVRLADLGRYATIGVNRLPAIYDPDYLVVIDQRVVDIHGDLFGIGSTTKFCNEEIKTHGDADWNRFKRFWPVENGSVFSEQFEDGLFFGYSVIFAAINLAYLMGASRIILAGVDMNDCSHFLDKRGSQNPFPSLDIIIRDFERVKDFARKRGAEIFNANPDSAVTCFPVIDIRGL